MGDLWKNLGLDPELLPFMTLSDADVSQLTELAMCAADPSAWLTDELHKRARKKRDLKAYHKAERMAKDMKRIGNPGAWPSKRLPVKTQPWQNENGKSMQFGFILHYDFLTVHGQSDEAKTYDTIEDLVEMWSVD